MAGNTVSRAKHRVIKGREKTAGVLDRAGDVVRGGSHQAAKFIDKGGAAAADTLQSSAARVDPHTRGGLRGYIGRHPRRFILLAVLLAGAMFLIVRSRGGDEFDDDYDF
jgi:hypothetical protein